MTISNRVYTIAELNDVPDTCVRHIALVVQGECLHCRRRFRRLQYRDDVHYGTAFCSPGCSINHSRGAADNQNRWRSTTYNIHNWISDDLRRSMSEELLDAITNENE